MGLSLNSRPAEAQETREAEPLAELLSAYKNQQQEALEEVQRLSGQDLRTRLERFREEQGFEAAPLSEQAQQREEMIKLLAYADNDLDRPRQQLVGRIMSQLRRAPIEQRSALAQQLFDQLEAADIADPVLVGELISAGFRLGGDDIVEIAKSADSALIRMGKEAIASHQGGERDPDTPFPQDLVFGAYISSNLLGGPRNPLMRALMRSRTVEQFVGNTQEHFQQYLREHQLPDGQYFVDQSFYQQLAQRYGMERRLNAIDTTEYLDMDNLTDMHQRFLSDIDRLKGARDQALSNGKKKVAQQIDNELDARRELQQRYEEIAASSAVLSGFSKSFRPDTRHLHGTISQVVGVPIDLINTGIEKAADFFPRLPRFDDINIYTMALGAGAASAMAIGGISLSMPFITHGWAAIRNPFSAWGEAKGLAGDVWQRAPTIGATMALAGTYLAADDPKGAERWVRERWHDVKALGSRIGSTEVASGAARVLRQGWESMIKGRLEGVEENFERIWNWVKGKPQYLLSLGEDGWDRVVEAGRKAGMSIEQLRERYSALNALQEEVTSSLNQHHIRGLNGWTTAVSDEKFDTFLRHFLRENQDKDLAEGGEDDAVIDLAELRQAEFYSQADYDRIPQNLRNISISDALARRLLELARGLESKQE